MYTLSNVRKGMKGPVWDCLPILWRRTGEPQSQCSNLSSLLLATTAFEGDFFSVFGNTQKQDRKTNIRIKDRVISQVFSIQKYMTIKNKTVDAFTRVNVIE